MDSISIDILPAYASYGLMGETVHFSVNGRNLIDILGEAERRFFEKGSRESELGFYMGLEPEVFLSGLRDEHGKMAVLKRQGFTAMEFWPLYVHVQLLEDVVIWDGFEQSDGGLDLGSDSPEYRGLRFIFDRQQYELELVTLRSLVVFSGIDDF